MWSKLQLTLSDQLCLHPSDVNNRKNPFKILKKHQSKFNQICQKASLKEVQGATPFSKGK